jgi:hypothetical protein
VTDRLPKRTKHQAARDPMREFDLLLLEDLVMRKPLNSTPLAAALQAASLLAVAAGIFGILISNIISQRAYVARVEAPSKVQLLASPGDSDANSR